MKLMAVGMILLASSSADDCDGGSSEKSGTEVEIPDIEVDTDVCRLDPAKNKDAEKFILTCIKEGGGKNLKDGDDGEKLVGQCERTATRLYCKPVFKVKEKNDSEFVRCENVTKKALIDACKRKGWKGVGIVELGTEKKEDES